MTDTTTTRDVIYRTRKAAQAAASLFDDPSIDGSDAVGEPADDIAALELAAMRANTWAAFVKVVADLDATIDAAIDADDPEAWLADRGYTADGYALIDAVQEDAEHVAALAAEWGDLESAVSGLDDGALVGQYDDDAEAAEAIVYDYHVDTLASEEAEPLKRLLQTVVVDWAATWQANVRHDFTYHEPSGLVFRNA